MNIPSLKQKAEAIRQRLEEVENHIAALESDAHAMLGTTAEAQAVAARVMNPPKTEAVVLRGKSKRAAARKSSAKKISVNSSKKKNSTRSSNVSKKPTGDVAPVAAKAPARKSPKKTSRKNGTKSPSTRKASAAVPASAPVVGNGNGVGGVDGDFDALG